MPIEPCTNKEGKKGFRWGGPDAPCQKDKKTAIRVGLKVEGPKKFSEIVKKEHSKGELSSAEYNICRAVLFEEMVKSEVQAQVKQYKPGSQDMGDRGQRESDWSDFNEDEKDKTKSYVSQKTRDEMDSSDFGWPEMKKYPVKDESHFHAAVKLLGRAPSEKQAMIKRNLTRIAKKRNYKLPDSWTTEKE